MRSIFHAALVAATLFLCAGSANAQNILMHNGRTLHARHHTVAKQGAFGSRAAGASSTVSNLPTNTTSPMPPNSCLYVDQAGADTKMCSLWVHTLLGGSVLGVADGGSGISFWPPADLVIGNGTQAPNFLAPVNGDCAVGVAGQWTAQPCPGGGSGSVTSVGLSLPGFPVNITGSPISSAGILTATPAGTSGGLVYFNSPSSMTSSGVLASGLPILGGGAGGTPTTGTLSGNTTKFATVSGSLTSSHCAAFDANGNVVDNGGPCGSGGTGTVLSVGISVPGSSILGVSGSPITSSGVIPITTTGTSGGIPYFSSTTQLNTSAALTANLPVIGGGAGTAPTVGTVSGNTTKFATVSGSLVSGDCLKADASGNIADQGAACGSGGGGGGSVSVTAGSPNVLINPTPGTGTFTVATTIPQHPQAGSSYTPVAGDGGATLLRTNPSAQTDTMPDTSGSFAAGFGLDLFTTGAKDTISRTSTSLLNGLTQILLGANQDASFSSDGTNWHVALSVPQPPTQTGTTCLYDTMTWAACGSGGGGGGVNVTSATPNIVINPSPGTGTFTIGVTNPFNTIAGSSYGLAATDSGKTVALTSGSATVTSIAASSTTGFGSGFETLIATHSAGDTFTPTTSTVNGQSSLILGKYQSADVQGDGSNYQAYLSLPMPSTQTGANCLLDNMTWGACGGGSLPTIASGHVIGNGTSGNAIAADTSLVGGAGIAVSQSGGTITVTNTATGGSGSGAVVPPGGRLSLAPYTPVLANDVVGATRIYYTCYNGGGTIPYYNGSSDANDPMGFCQLSTALEPSGAEGENSGDLFDIWYVHGATHICVATNGSGGGWTSDTGGSLTARGTGYTQIDPSTRGFYTNANVIAHCVNGTLDFGSVAANQATYLGTMYTTAAGQTTMQIKPASAPGGSNTIMGLYNAYNRVPQEGSTQDSTGSAYTSGTWRYANGSAGNRVTFVDGLSQSPVIGFGSAAVFISNNTAQIGMVENKASGIAPASTAFLGNSTIETTMNIQDHFGPSMGLNFIQSVEQGSTGDSFEAPQLTIQVPM